MKIKPPSTMEKFRAVHQVRFICAKCLVMIDLTRRPKNCPLCAKGRRRLQEVKAWMRARGLLQEPAHETR